MIYGPFVQLIHNMWKAKLWVASFKQGSYIQHNIETKQVKNPQDQDVIYERYDSSNIVFTMLVKDIYEFIDIVMKN